MFFISFWQILKSCQFSTISLSKEVFTEIFHYGWKTQLSVFIQFLNYRLSFYFLEYFEGISAVGIFSIGITFSEAIWTITRSIAVILYSEVVSCKNRNMAIFKTKKSIRTSFWVVFVFILGIIIIPSSVYELIFGSAFRNTKHIMLLLSPGILAIAVSDMVGYYFSATKQLKILNIKSIAGLVIAVLFSIILIPKYGILGACISTTLSYCISAIFLFINFFKSTKFSYKDLLFNEDEIMMFKSEIRKYFKSE